MDIEKNVPVPIKPSRRGASKYPFAKMEVGDSFVVPLNGKSNWAFIFSAISIAQNKLPMKFTTRLLADGTRRVWRVE